MSTSINMQNLVTAEQMASILEHAVKNVVENPGLSRSLPPMIIRGPAGVGKSTIVKDLANRLGIGFVDIRLAQMERVDVAGLPSVENGTTKWNVPNIWPRDPDSKGIIFLDEITAAPADVQVAAYSIILDRMIPNSDYRIPDGWYIVAAGNRVKDRAVAKPMSSALANRFAHFEIDVDPEQWGAWAICHDVHPSVTGFIKYRPMNLFKTDGQNLEQGWPSPRSWERVSNVVKLFAGDSNLSKIVAGLIGDQVACEFMAFHKLNSKFDSVLEMLTDPKAKIVIPERADERYAMASAVSYLVWNGKDEDDIKNRIGGMYRITMEMSSDFSTMVIKNAMLGNSRISNADATLMIARHESYPQWKAKFGHFNTRARK